MKTLEFEQIDSLNLEDTVHEGVEYIECSFSKCEFINVNFKNCTFKNCVFQKCVFANAKFDFCTMYNGEFTDSMLIGINWNTLKSKLRGAEPIVKLSGNILKYNSFSQMSFRKFVFSNNTFKECYFLECELMDADFCKDDLEKTQFSDCNLSRADFRDSYGYEINITNNKITGAKFSLPEVVNLLRGLEIIIE